MLRLPHLDVVHPRTVEEAVAALAEGGRSAMVLAGGTDLLPNLKHRLHEPRLLVSLDRLADLRGIEFDGEGGIRIGAMTPLAAVAEDWRLAQRAPALAQAAGLVAGPQIRNMGTIGGNICLDTRCQWYNQSHFWRAALGYCLKKDGTVCHVVAGGSKCVAAASNDTVPALMTLGAILGVVGPEGRSEVPIDRFWRADGIANRRLAPDQILTDVYVPPPAPGHRGAYGKLRDRGSIDFPLLGVAVRLDLDEEERGGPGESGENGGLDGWAGGGPGPPVVDADVVLVALQARPVRIPGVAERLRGLRPGTEDFRLGIDEIARAARRRAHPMPNIPGDADYRREMVPVYVRRTLEAAASGCGPVHAV